MGEEIQISSKKGLVIPLAIIGILVTLTGTMLGVFFRAGTIVANQYNQDTKWSSLRDELKEELDTVREVKAEVAQHSRRLESIEQSVSNFMQASHKTQSEISAKLDSTSNAIQEELRRQQKAFDLLQDYTEGRISGLPYRPPDTSAGGGQP